jgi:hypothetical protein
MRATVPSELLLRFLQATPEQQAAIERILGWPGDGGHRGKADRHLTPALSPVEAEREATARVAAAPGRPMYAFRKVGGHWRMIWQGEEFFLEDTLGARYLDYLLHHPNEAIEAHDLEVAIEPAKGLARARDSVQVGVDREALRDYLRELGKLRGQREDARSEGNDVEVQQLDEEIAGLEVAIKRGARTVDTGERARGNVSKAVSAVMRKLASRGRVEQRFLEHLRESLSMGFKCLYSQPKGRIWE